LNSTFGKYNIFALTWSPQLFSKGLLELVIQIHVSTWKYSIWSIKFWRFHPILLRRAHAQVRYLKPWRVLMMLYSQCLNSRSLIKLKETNVISFWCSSVWSGVLRSRGLISTEHNTNNTKICLKNYTLICFEQFKLLK
jgi:hypothetical protein